MPSLTRWFIKSSLVYIVAALSAGLALAARIPLNLPSSLATLGPIYFHLLMVGWVTQLIFGVVYWMFPKYSQDRPRGSVALGWATFGLLNAGLILRLVGEPLQTLHPQRIWGWLLAISALSQWLAGLGFVYNSWARVKGR